MRKNWRECDVQCFLWSDWIIDHWRGLFSTWPKWLGERTGLGRVPPDSLPCFHYPFIDLVKFKSRCCAGMCEVFHSSPQSLHCHSRHWFEPQKKNLNLPVRFPKLWAIILSKRAPKNHGNLQDFQRPMPKFKSKVLAREPTRAVRIWLVVSIHPKNISQIGNLPQIGLKIKNIWNHHPVLSMHIMHKNWGTWSLTSTARDQLHQPTRHWRMWRLHWIGDPPIGGHSEVWQTS